MLILNKLDSVQAEVSELISRSNEKPEIATPGVSSEDSTRSESVSATNTASFWYSTPEDILEWPVFGGRYKIDSIVDLISKNEKEQNVDLSRENGGNNDPVDWSEVKSLVEAFAVHIHIKNPIIDIKRIRDAAQIATNSSQLDGYYSILVSSARLDINNFF